MVDERVVPAGDAPLLASRLAVPAPPAIAVARPRLHRLLDAGVRTPVTLVVASAGWGKTVLLSSWARPERHLVWLTAEPGDDGRHGTYLHAALCKAAGLPLSASAEDRSFLARLADALTRLPEPLVLVIDNAHEIRDPGVFDSVAFLVRYAGARLRLVVAARAEPALPLARWRLSGDLTEIRTADLSFTLTETAELLARHGLVLPDSHVEQLWRRTEGWAAGLRLAALALRVHPDPSEVVSDFGGDDQAVVDYLMSEVLAPQPAEIRDALVCTSILGRICGGLVDTLTGRTDGELILSKLERADGFVIPLGTHPPAYRYHRMFGEALRAALRRQSPGRIPELHRRAAAWFAAHGQPGEALLHALAAADWARATRVLAEHWHELVLDGHPTTRDRRVPVVPPAEVVRADPEVALATAAQFLDRHDLQAADAYVRLAGQHRQLLAGQRRERFERITAALELAGAQRGGDPGQVPPAASQLLARLPAGREHRGARASALTALGSAQLDQGEWEAAEAALLTGRAEALEAGSACPALIATSRLAYLRALRGQLHAAARTVREALDLPTCPGYRHAAHCVHAYLAAATVDLAWDRLGDAAANLNLAAAACDATHAPVPAAAVTALRAELRYAQGELRGAYEVLLAGRRELAGAHLPRHAECQLAVVEAQVHTAYGDTGTVRGLLGPWLPADRTGAVAVALARAHLRDGDPAGAAGILPAWDGDRAAVLPLSVRVDAGLLDAVASRRLGDRRRGSQILERVLRLAEPEGFRRAFTRAGPEVRQMLVEHVDSGTAYWSLVSDLVAATRESPPESGPASSGLDQQLSERELMVLRYLQSILSNEEIAAELHLSVNTVKTHVRNIYRKLGATRRRDAVRRARELRLL